MKIAICDTDTALSCKLKHILYEYSNNYKLDFFVETFNSGEQLLSSQNNFLLIFIEYTLDGINGLETAKEIYSRNRSTKIIFLTNDTKFIFDAFHINAYCFIKKPLHENEIKISLNRLFFSTHINYPIQINDGDMTHCVDTDEIIYLEADNKYCRIHLKDNIITSKKTMARIYAALPKTYFQKINRAFIVNYKFVNKYNTENVFLKNGEGLHITRTYYKDFKHFMINTQTIKNLH
jgi:DNA-binding LytR/AlgR family response regulator